MSRALYTRMLLLHICMMCARSGGRLTKYVRSKDRKVSSLLGSVIFTHVTQKLADVCMNFTLGKPWVVLYSYILRNTLAVHM